MKSWTRLDWLILILFGGLVVLFYWPILIPNPADRQSFPPGDFSHQFWAFATFEARELSAGRLPLWNPYTFAGAPFWADVQAAVFYPPSLLTHLLAAPWGFSLFALEVEAIAHFWLAAVFMYLFIGHITGSRPAAFIAALTFTFSGYLTGFPSQQLAILEADVWLPLILFFIHRSHERWSHVGTVPSAAQSPLPDLLLAGLAWGMTLLAGHPQSALIVAYISSAYLLFLWLSTRPAPEYARARHTARYALRFFPYLLLFLVTGLALAAVQFLPAAEYTLLSIRAEGTYDNMSGGFSLIDVIQFLLPGQVSFYSPLYVGLIGLILAGWVTFTQPSRYTTFWAVVAFITLLISFGVNTFLYSPLYLFTPGFSIFRGQERWAFATAFSLCVLVGYGFASLLSQMARVQSQSASRQGVGSKAAGKSVIKKTSPVPRPTHRLLDITAYLFLFALLLVFLFFYGLNETGWTSSSPFYNLLAAATLLTVLLALTWLLWKFLATFQLPAAVLTILTAALICFDLFTVNWQTNLYPQPPAWHTRIPAAAAAIKKDTANFPGEPYRVYNEFRLYDNYGVPFEIEDLWGASPLRSDRYDQFLAPPMPIERTWELLNVKYVITWRQKLFVPSTIIFQEPAGDGTTYVHRLDQVGPRAWLALRAEIVDDETMLQKLADPNLDRRHVALLEPDAEPYVRQIINVSDLQPGESGDDGLGVDQSISRTPSALSATSQISRLTSHASGLGYQVTTPGPALLIFSEIYFPGWQATVDGQPAPLLRADYILRAVPVPAGEHTVELTFRPLSFTVGALISGVTLLTGVMIFIFLLSKNSKYGADEK